MEALFYLEAVDGQLEVYENKIVICRKGVAARSCHGKTGDRTILMDSISFITLREWTIWKRGQLEFGLDSAPTNVNPFATNKNSENSFILTKENYELAKEIKDYIEKRITEIRTPSAAPTASSQSGSADEILKYKNLLDMGAITQEEFDLKKKQLLCL